MFPVRPIQEELLKEIDKTVLDERRKRWKPFPPLPTLL